MSDVRRIMKISGNVTRWLAVDFAEDSIYLKNKKVTETEDSRNRQYVQKQIVKYVEEGFEEAEIIEKILNDNIMEKFEYLKNRGLNLEYCVTDWVETAIKKYNTEKSKEKEER